MNNKMTINPKKLGASIIEAAITKRKKSLQENVIQEVEHFLQKIADDETVKRLAEERIEFNQSKIEAIEKGKFSIDEVYGKVVFDDPDLNLTDPKRPK